MLGCLNQIQIYILRDINLWQQLNQILSIYLIKMSVKVAIRVRPFNQRQINLNSKCCVEMIDKKTKLKSDQSQKQYSKRQFTFDYSIWSHDGFETLENGLMIPVEQRYWDQTRVYKQIGIEIINNAWMGYNCCLFAYGQTGAGKSYSMLGYGLNKGIVPKTCEQIFTRTSQNVQTHKTYHLTVSMIQIYNQKVQDLLIDPSKRPKGGLQVRQNKTLGVYVQGVTKHKVASFKQIQKWMDQGSKHRSLASTNMNQYSSRAHTIISIQFIQREQINKNQVVQKTSTIHLIDLAGSQRVGKTGLSNSDRLKQAGNINKSLHLLGLVIQILAQKSQGRRKNQIVPYRSSQLTRILQNSLGGNSKTIMICAISPALDNFEQTLSTLKYADQVKKIKNNATVNQNLTDKIIRELKQQNQRLKKLITEYNEKSTISAGEQNELIANKQAQRLVQKNLYRTSFALQEFGQNQQNLLANMSGIDQQDSQINDFSVQQSFMDIQFLTDEPYITNINEDFMLNGRVKYSIQKQLIIGRKQGNPTPQVVLGALGIEKNHAKIFRRGDKLFISSYSQNAGDRTFVNGDNVYEETEIFHNDRIIFGTSCAFLVKTPDKLSRKQKQIPQSQLTYQFAIAELEQIQKNKSVIEQQQLAQKLKQMEREMEEQKKNMQKKMIMEKQIFQQQLKILKTEQENSQKNLLQELKKKEIDSRRLMKQNEEIQAFKRTKLELEQQLQKQRKQKEILQKSLQQSVKLEKQLKEEKSKQSEQKKLREQIQKMYNQKRAIQEKQLKIKQQKEEQERLAIEYQRRIQQSKIKIEQQNKRNQEILQKKQIICQNQNILNQRSSVNRKKKKQIEDLRLLLIKKQRMELQKKLVEILPMVTEMNLITKQMDRDIQFQVKIDYEYFGYYELSQCLKNAWYKSKIKIRIQINNSEEGRVYFWNLERFRNRFDLAKDMLEKFCQDPRNPILHDKDKDPFWDPPEPELIGQTFLTLQHLLYNLDYFNPTLKVINQKKLRGQMSVRIYPTNERGDENLSHQQQKQNQISIPRRLLEKDLHFVLVIDKLKMDEDLVDLYVEYELTQSSYKTAKYQTNKIAKSSNYRQINYQKKHTYRDISETTLLYLAGSQLCLKVYGIRKLKAIQKMNGSFVQDDQRSQSDFDDTASIKSVPVYSTNKQNGINETGSKKKGEIFINSDVMGKIEKQFSVYQTKTESIKHSSIKQSNGKGNINGSTGKKDEKCILF